MKSLRTLRYSLIAAAVAGGAVMSTPAFAGVAASATVSNIYLWRGLNLGQGAPEVAGMLEYDADVGAYAGIWASSSGPTQEVDTYFGFRGKAGDFGYNIAAYKYNYPDYANAAANTMQGNRISDFKEIYLNASMMGAFVDVYVGTGDTGAEVANKSNYYDIGYTYDKYTAKYGMYDMDDTNCVFGTAAAAVAPANTATSCGYSHLDVSYAYNANLSFTVSKIVNSDTKPELANDPLVALTYTLPLDLK